MILKALEPRDILTFPQCSLAVEQWYYFSISQFGYFRIQQFGSSVPCCGCLDKMDTAICCSSCYAWKHTKCIGLGGIPPGRQYICHDCHENNNRFPVLVPGGINATNGRKKRGPGCCIRVVGHPKVLGLCLSLPTHLRPEFRLLGNLHGKAQLLISYAVQFGGRFLGFGIRAG